MKSIWKGSIGFGLVNIPIKLYSATRQSNLDFDMVEIKNMGRVHFQRINEETGKEVKWEDIGKAYKLNGNYILLNDKDFENAAPEKSKVIEIKHFVSESEIDTIYYENSYFAEPEKSGTKAYALLRAALKESGKVGIGQFVLRTSEVLIVLKPFGKILVLSRIRFAEEIRETGEFNLPSESSVKASELKMALALVNQYGRKFDISKFKDEYSSKLLKLIKGKSKGKKLTLVVKETKKSKAPDIMEQLKASLKKAS